MCIILEEEPENASQRQYLNRNQHLENMGKYRSEQGYQQKNQGGNVLGS